MRRFSSALALLAALSAPAFAQTPAPPPPIDWHLQDPTTGGHPGAAVERAYELLKGRAPARTVVVAVIDGGIDTAHVDLRGRLWVNAREVAGNNRDDDGNGYVDDVHGWNFIGGADGRNVDAAQYEVTREYARLRGKYEGKSETDVAAADRDELAYFGRVRAEWAERRAEAEQQFPTVEGIYTQSVAAMATLRAALGKPEGADVTAEEAASVPVTTPALRQAKQALQFLAANGITYSDLVDYRAQLKNQSEIGFNPDANERAIVGDDPANLTQRVYGNADVTGPDAGHGTHVAGIIAALRGNGVGAVGVADAVRIMAVRAVPNGDERDKDIANAIRYAADNGAHVINMSFGKAYSPDKPIVDEAVRYAESKGVLLVHAAGNDGKNVDKDDNFPEARFADGTKAALWIEVGASGPVAGEALAAEFSNYGGTSVDLFAPGADIYSTIPGGGYGRKSGTSMAAPVASGVAALVMAYYPTLTAAQVRAVLMESVRAYPNLTVVRPGGEERAGFATLSVTGGVINAAAALERAAALAGGGAQ